jgi:hypothetical protein
LVLFVVSGGGNRQAYPGASGYADEFQNAGGAKQQLLSLIRSVRTVMRGNFIYFAQVFLIFFVSIFSSIDRF